MTPDQCRAARRLVELSQVALAHAAVIRPIVIADFERGLTPAPAVIDLSSEPSSGLVLSLSVWEIGAA